MKTNLTYSARQLTITLCFTFILGFSLPSFSQGITVYQYRQIPDDQVEEFIKRETTYWSKVAEKGFEKGNLTFWALLQKVGGYDLQNSSNFLFINTYNDIDKLGEVWDAASVFPDVPMEKMETFSMGKTTSTIFLKTHWWVQAENANPGNDFKFLKMIYHQTSSPNAFAQAEVDHWGPFIKEAMDKKHTTQRAWGNSVLLSPSTPDMHFKTISYDIYPTLKDALDPTWDESMVLPEGMSKIMELESGPRMDAVYRIVKAVSANNQ